MTPVAPGPAPSPHAAPLGWGLIGTGGICARMARALSHVHDARLVAVGSRTRDRAQAFVDDRQAAHAAPRGQGDVRAIRAHGDYRALVEDPAVDVVYVGTPNHDHAASVRLALEAGKAVLCEKPFTLHQAEARELAALARERGVFLMEAMWTRFLPAIVRARHLVAQGAIGQPLSVLAQFGFVADFGPGHRVHDPAQGGGALLDLGVYPLSLAAFLLGPIERAQALAQRGGTGVDVHLAFQLAHAGGALSQGLCSLRANTSHGATVLGTAGRIEIDPPFYGARSLRLLRNAEGFGETHEAVREDLPAPGDGFVPQVLEVHRCLRAGRTESDVMPLDESVALMGWMDEMRRQVGVRYPGEDE